MEQVARSVREKLVDHLVGDADAVNAVGYFNEETQEFIYLSSELEQQYDKAALTDILENAFLDVWGAINQEEMYGSELHATTRVYDTYVDTVIALGETKGIVFILDRDADYQYPELVESIENTVNQYEVGAKIKA